MKFGIFGVFCIINCYSSRSFERVIRTGTCVFCILYKCFEQVIRTGHSDRSARQSSETTWLGTAATKSSPVLLRMIVPNDGCEGPVRMDLFRLRNRLIEPSRLTDLPIHVLYEIKKNIYICGKLIKKKIGKPIKKIIILESRRNRSRSVYQHGSKYSNSKLKI